MKYFIFIALAAFLLLFSSCEKEAVMPTCEWYLYQPLTRVCDSQTSSEQGVIERKYVTVVDVDTTVSIWIGLKAYSRQHIPETFQAEADDVLERHLADKAENANSFEGKYRWQTLAGEVAFPSHIECE